MLTNLWKANGPLSLQTSTLWDSCWSLSRIWTTASLPESCSHVYKTSRAVSDAMLLDECYHSIAWLRHQLWNYLQSASMKVENLDINCEISTVGYHEGWKQVSGYEKFDSSHYQHCWNPLNRNPHEKDMGAVQTTAEKNAWKLIWSYAQ